MTAVQRLAVGARDGVIATAAMSVVLVAADATGVLRPLPPRQIMRQVLPAASERTVDVATLVGHTGYGAAAGAAYRAVLPSAHAGPVTGALYGVALWVAGYEVWVPLAGFLPPAHRDRPGRTVTMLVSHIVYGSVLGALSRAR